RFGVDYFEHSARAGATDENDAVITATNLLQRPRQSFKNLFFGHAVVMNVRFTIRISVKANSQCPVLIVLMLNQLIENKRAKPCAPPALVTEHLSVTPHWPLSSAPAAPHLPPPTGSPPAALRPRSYAGRGNRWLWFRCGR